MKVHKIEYWPHHFHYFTACKRVYDSWEYSGAEQWKLVTCKRCLAKRPKPREEKMSVNCTGCQQPQEECGEYSYPGCVVRGRQAETIALREKLASAESEVARLTAVVNQWESEDEHEAMDCYMSHQKLAATEALLDRAIKALEECTGGDLASGEGIYKAEIAREALEAIQAARNGETK